MRTTTAAKIARDALCELGWLTRRTAPSKLPANSLTIVTFHRVLPPELKAQYPLPGLVVTPAELDFSLKFINQHYSCHPLGTAFELMKAPDATRKPLLAITFDDGQLDNLQYAAPVLANNGAKATFYIVPRMTQLQQALWHDRLGFAARSALAGNDALAQLLDNRLHVGPDQSADPVVHVQKVLAAAKKLPPVDRTKLLSEIDEASAQPLPDWSRLLQPSEVVKLRDLGHEIGSHTNSHVLLPQTDSSALSSELSESKRMLEEWLDSSVAHFCYPNGDNDSRTQKAVRDAGYSTAVTTSFGFNAPSTDAFSLKRFDITSGSMTDRKARLSQARLAWGISQFRRER